ncbi:uncharacterized protein G2W53_014493 [Senna tora]|uniref:Uncharacterized protein n=1 Tax=Senna tora TaxID=362788 RepID=A0A834WTL7_9FABA|nr:uncharacterized protein G2W53_014493 [Senna tora]
MTLHTFHEIMCPIRALNPIGFQNTTRSVGLTHLCNNTFVLYFLKSFEIQSRFSIQNVFRQDFTDLPFHHKSHSSIKSTRIPDYKAKRSVDSLVQQHV